MRINVSSLSLRVGGRALTDGLDLDVPAGAFVAIVGPNGSGKSSLLRAVYRSLRPDRGTVLIGDADVWATKPRHVARLRSVVTQHQTSVEGLRVREVVATGRHAHQPWYARESAEDHRHVDRALSDSGAAHLAERAYETLSGGERQRVLLARALAQQAPVILLDEPTNHLDIKAQLDLLDTVARLPLTRVVVLHDLDQAVAHADLLVVLHDGAVHAAGPPAQVFTSALAEEVFGVRAELVTHPITLRPHVVTAPLQSR